MYVGILQSYKRHFIMADDVGYHNFLGHL